MFRCSPQAHSQHTQPLYGISSRSSYVIQYGSCSRIYIYLQGIHSDCHPSSSCHDPGYIPSRLELTNPQACQALLKGLKDTYVYRYADDFCRICMVFTVSPLAIFSLYYMYTVSRHLLGESFNHQLLTYLPKRIHFSTRVFNMRMNLAVMDWVRCMIYAVCIFISISL